jgi:transposase
VRGKPACPVLRGDRRSNAAVLPDRTLRPVKIQQRTSGGCWRTVAGLTDFAIVASYLDTATKWGLNKLDALNQLFTTGAWLPPALHPI